jgi:hypothetical protein
MKVYPLLAPPPAMTVTGPLPAPDGTVQTICPSDQETMDADAPPANRTVPALDPKFVPVMVTCVPVPAEALPGFIDEMTGAGRFVSLLNCMSSMNAPL